MHKYKQNLNQPEKIIYSNSLAGQLAAKSVSALFPRRCPVCDRVVEPRGALICPKCRTLLSYIKEPYCKCCGKIIRDSDEELCANCRKHHFSFEYGIALMEYNDATARSMGAIKYKGRREYLDFYGLECARFLRRRLMQMRVAALVPVPIHTERLRKRGYNQAEILANTIGKVLGIPVYPAALKRGRNTSALKDLNAAERLKMLKNAFSAGYIPPDLKSVCLIDDIFTTGSTIEACTSVLKESGVARVYSLCICIRSDI